MAGAVLIGLAVGAFVAYRLYRSSVDGVAGGASSPEGVMTSLADALNTEDPAGVVALLDPDESRDIAQLVKRLQDKAVELGIATKGEKVAKGIDLKVENLDVRVDELDDGVARVTAQAGRISYSVDKSAVAEKIGNHLAGAVDGSSDFRDAKIDSDDGRTSRRPWLIVVKNHGRWFISPLLTFGDYVTFAAGLPAGDFSAAAHLQADGAASPKAAVEAFAHAVSRDRSRDLASVLDRGESRFVRVFERAIDKLLADGDFDFSVDGVESHLSNLSGGEQKATINEADGELTYTVDGRARTFSWTFDGACASWTEPADRSGEKDQSCVLGEEFSDVSGVDSAFLVVAKWDGEWVVRPMSTLARLGQDLLEGFDEAEVLRALGFERDAAPVGDLAFDGTNDVDLNSAGFVTFAYNPQAPEAITIRLDERSYTVDLQPLAAADELEDSVQYVGGGLYMVAKPGAYRVIVRNESYEGGKVTVTARPVQRQAVTLPATLAGSVPAGGALAYTFHGESGKTLVMPNLGSIQPTLFRTDGAYVASSGAVRMESRDYVLYVRNDRDSEQSVTGTLSYAAVGFGNGQLTTSGTYRTNVSMFLQAGRSVTVTVTPGNSSDDVTVTVLSPINQVLVTADRGTRGNEVVQFTPNATGTYTLQVQEYNRRSGSFTASLS